MPGRCKTRLEPLLGPAGCARLQAALLRHAADWAAGVAPGRAWMALDGTGFAPDGVRVFAQATGGFGERMRAAVATVAATGGPLLFVGTDLPVLGADHARAAVAALGDADMAIGPAADGGWYLLALRERCDAVFEDVPEALWGGPRALEATVAAAERAGLRVARLATEHDLDVPQDAARALGDPRTPRAVRAALGDPRPLISVCVPTLQEEDQIGRLLDHLAALPGRLEVIVADGGSTDSTRAVARGHGRADAVLEVCGGRASQLNVAAAAARGDVLVFLHADSRLPSTAPDSLTAALADPGLAGGNFALRFDGEDRFSALLGRVYAYQRRHGFYYGDSSVWLRREVFAALGGFREQPIMDDYDLVRRLEAHGRTAALPGPATTSARRWKAMGVTRTMVSWWVIRWLYVLGVPARRLAGLYRVVR